MSDLIERLRHRFPERDIVTDRTHIAWEAAEEIEQLKELLRQAIEESPPSCHGENWRNRARAYLNN